MLPKGHASLEIFLSQLENVLTNDLGDSSQGNLHAEKWKTLSNLTSDWSVVIKGADKSSSAVAWDSADYILEVESYLNDKPVYKNV